MAVSATPKNARNGTLTLSNGARTWTLLYTEGDFSVSGLTEGQKGVEAIQNRGSHHALVYTNQTYPEFSFSGTWTDISDGTDVTALNVVTQTGSCAGDAGSISSTAPYTLDLLWTCEGTDLGDPSDHSLALADCRLSMDGTEGMPANTYSITGVCYGTLTPT